MKNNWFYIERNKTMNNRFLALVLLSTPLVAYKETVREIAQDVARSDHKGAKAHLQRLHRFGLSKHEHKNIIKDLQENAEHIRTDQEDHLSIAHSAIDTSLLLGGTVLGLKGLRALLGFGKKVYIIGGFGFSWEKNHNYALGIASLAAGLTAISKGYQCWYQQRCIKAAKKVEEVLEDAYTEVKEG